MRLDGNWSLNVVFARGDWPLDRSDVISGGGFIPARINVPSMYNTSFTFFF